MKQSVPPPKVRKSQFWTPITPQRGPVFHADPQAGQPKLPPAAKGLLECGLMRLDTTSRIPRPLFTERGLDALRVMMADRRLANPEKFAHVRQELGLDG
jgi:hypothetical protein